MTATGSSRLVAIIYHPSFNPPAHYQPAPSRVGISWVYDDHLNITGQADVGVNVYVSTTIGWGIFSTDISMEVDASVSLHGPPLAGVTHLRLWFISVSVRFGPRHNKQPKLSMVEFLIMVKQVKTAEEANQIPDHLVSVTKGLITPNGKQAVSGVKGSPVLVRGSQLVFEVQTRVPIAFAQYTNGGQGMKRP